MIDVRFELRGFGWWTETLESNAPNEMAKSIRKKGFLDLGKCRFKFEPVAGTDDAAWIVRVGNILGSEIEDLIGRCEWRTKREGE